MSSKEAEAVCLIIQNSGRKFAVPDANFALLCHASLQAKSLQAISQGGGNGSRAAFSPADCHSRSGNIRPGSVLKADELDIFYDMIDVETCVYADCLRFFQGHDAIRIQERKNTVFSGLIIFKLNAHHIILSTDGAGLCMFFLRCNGRTVR